MWMPKQVPAEGGSLLWRPRFADSSAALAEPTTPSHSPFHPT